MDERLMVIFRRRSVREFSEREVAEREVTALLEAGMAAPSARNRKPWHFVVVRERATLKAITEIHPHAQMLAQARLAIAVCGDREISPDFWVQDCAAATENILIAAATLGLGAVWLGVHPRAEREEGLKRLFGIPEKFGLLSLVAVGWPKQPPLPRTQFDPGRVHRERW